MFEQFNGEMTVDEYVSPILYFSKPDTSFQEIEEKMHEMGFRHVPVMEGDQVVGIISDRDLMLASRLGQAQSLLAKDVMVSDPFCVTTGTPIDEVAFELSNRKIGSAIVIDQSGKIEGIFTSTDALNALVELARGQSL